ncbi:MAG: hypothetical protein H0V78_11820 [Burkholderiales bacterium]|nr:hypothetical protein [Burkholderiales bacterium]
MTRELNFYEDFMNGEIRVERRRRTQGEEEKAARRRAKLNPLANAALVTTPKNALHTRLDFSSNTD